LYSARIRALRDHLADENEFGRREWSGGQIAIRYAIKAGPSSKAGPAFNAALDVNRGYYTIKEIE